MVHTIQIQTLGAQGDVLFRRVHTIPAAARQQTRNGPLIVAHSETGHHHTIEAEGVIHFEVSDPLICYLRVDADHADVVHHRPYDTHATLRLPTGNWEVRRQREHTPEGWQRVED